LLLYAGNFFSFTILGKVIFVMKIDTFTGMVVLDVIDKKKDS